MFETLIHEVSRKQLAPAILNKRFSMSYKSLSVMCLVVFCMIGCSTDSTNDSIFPVPPTVDAPTTDEADDTPNNNASANLPDPIIEPVEEHLPDFHGEYISGKLDKSKSDFRFKRINGKGFGYYYTLALELDDSLLIRIILSEPAPGITPDLGQVIDDEDILLVKLDKLRKPGIWDGVLVKNVTTNFSFDDE